MDPGGAKVSMIVWNFRQPQNHRKTVGQFGLSTLGANPHGTENFTEDGRNCHCVVAS